MEKNSYSLPTLALVGRPNVGKSALFNRLCKKRIAIVDEAEGVTRDRLYAEADFFGKPIRVVDTGGIASHHSLPFQEQVRRQTEFAIAEADSLVMVVDAKVGVTPMDEFVASLLHKTKKPLCLAVNKIDDLSHLDLLHPFYSLGITRIVATSAEQSFQIAELLEAALTGVDFIIQEPAAERAKIAIIGRPNVGKSTLLNALLSEERSIVSPVPGTTRDSIDVDIEQEGQSFTLIDTAGIRRKRAEHEAVDKFACVRTERAIERADICLLLLDAEGGITTQEKRIAQSIEEQGKGCILLFNKWDKVHGFRQEHCLKSLEYDTAFVSHCPTLFISAQKKRGITSLFPLIQKVYKDLRQRITTGQLNKFMERAIQKYHPPMIQGRRLRIYYLSQVEVAPPHFVLFVNNPLLMCETYKKYLINQLREAYGFAGIPLRFSLRGREEKPQEN